jgi:hypothetical protein
MKRRVFALVFALGALACGALSSSAGAQVTVSVTPATGKPTTKFVVRFQAPTATGTAGALRTHYVVLAASNKGKRCTSSVASAVGPTLRGARVRVALRPTGGGHVWCAGRFHGTIERISILACGPVTQIACPVVQIAPVIVARFSFRVRKAATNKSKPPGVGPTFTGLQSATDCIHIEPQTVLPPPVQRVVQLSWNSATDPSTPSSRIVYDIYYSPTSGGEDYSHPNWTTAPGATHYTADISRLGPAYFVVRARDQAGHEDQNTVQVMAMDVCLPVIS